MYNRVCIAPVNKRLWGELWTIVRYDRPRPAPHSKQVIERGLVVSNVGYLLNFRTFGHFEYASITTNHVSYRNGPAKSMWMRCHGPSGTGHLDRVSGRFGPVSAKQCSPCSGQQCRARCYATTHACVRATSFGLFRCASSAACWGL